MEQRKEEKLPGSSLILGDKVIWTNPPGIGHTFIGLRKGIYEDWLVDQMKQGVPPEERARNWQEMMEKHDGFPPKSVDQKSEKSK